MKEIKKNSDGLFVCEECSKTFSCLESLTKHIKKHTSILNYYNKWLKEEGDGSCQECQSPTQFNKLNGYRKFCSKKCSHITLDRNRHLFSIEKKKSIKEGYNFICSECKERFKTSIKLTNHIISEHGLKKYYDKYLKKEGEGICKICGNPTEFYERIDLGYRKCCSNECSNKYRLMNRSKTNLEKYKVENPFEIEGMIQKIKKTCLKKYGTENNMQSERGKEEFKKSMNEKYGVDWPLQNRDTLERGLKSSRKMKKFRDTDLWYQGTYELDFLNKYYDKFSDLQRGPSIHYLYEGKNKVYHPDFYIPSLNLVVEIKSSWILNKDVEIDEKKKATIARGFRYILILDKNYSSI